MSVSAIHQALLMVQAASAFPATPFTINFTESGVPAVGTAISTFYTTSHGITGITAKFANRIYTADQGSGIPGADYDGNFAWVFATTTIGFQIDAALQARAVTFIGYYGGNWGTLTVKTSNGVTENIARSTGGQFSWLLQTEVDLDALAVGIPSLATGYLTEFYYTNGTAGTYALDNLTIL